MAIVHGTTKAVVYHIARFLIHKASCGEQMTYKRSCLKRSETIHSMGIASFQARSFKEPTLSYLLTISILAYSGVSNDQTL
jgi:hypothetical protein